MGVCPFYGHNDELAQSEQTGAIRQTGQLHTVRRSRGNSKLIEGLPGGMRTGHAKGHATSTWGKETDARVSADGIGRSVQPTSIKREILGKVISPPFFSPSPSSPPSSDHRMEMLYGHSIGIGIWELAFRTGALGFFFCLFYVYNMGCRAKCSKNASEADEVHSYARNFIVK